MWDNPSSILATMMALRGCYNGVVWLVGDFPNVFWMFKAMGILVYVSEAILGLRLMYILTLGGD